MSIFDDGSMVLFTLSSFYASLLIILLKSNAKPRKQLYPSILASNTWMIR